MARPARKPTSAEIAIVKRVGRDLTRRDAAAMIGCHRTVVDRWILELGVEVGWTAKRLEALRLGQPTGMTASQCRRQRRAMGLTRRRSWDLDREWLGRHIGRGFDYCAKKLGRSRRAVEVEAWRMDIHPDETSKTMSPALAGDVIGVHPSTISKWIRLGDLDATDGRVTTEALRLFVIKHPGRVNPKTVGDSWSTLVRLLAKRL